MVAGDGEVEVEVEGDRSVVGGVVVVVVVVVLLLLLFLPLCYPATSLAWVHTSLYAPRLCESWVGVTDSVALALALALDGALRLSCIVLV
jgi:hypothetical protein